MDTKELERRFTDDDVGVPLMAPLMVHLEEMMFDDYLFVLLILLVLQLMVNIGGCHLWQALEHQMEPAEADPPEAPEEPEDGPGPGACPKALG